MTTIAGTPAPTGGARVAEKPFVVTGTLHGRRQRVAVASLPAVLAQIVRWTEQDPDATGSWALSEDYSAPVTVVARVRPGLIGERGRSAHLFSLVPGVSHRCRLTTSCGQSLSILDLEWLAVGEGMPCEHCLRSVSTATAPPARPPHPSRARPLRSPWPLRLAY